MRPAPSGSTISPALRAIVMRGLSPRPGDRFPTMEALIVQLGRDRATPWRVTSRVAAVLAAMLALGLVADAVVRDRVAGNIAEAFAATARQTDRAVHLLAGRFDAMSNQVYTFEDVPSDRTGYQVQPVVLSDPLVAGDAPIGTLVMARAATSPLALFPGARLVFALALLAALTIAATTSIRARHITEGRV